MTPHSIVSYLMAEIKWTDLQYRLCDRFIPYTLGSCVGQGPGPVHGGQLQDAEVVQQRGCQCWHLTGGAQGEGEAGLKV